jgi:hypothetical protein
LAGPHPTGAGHELGRRRRLRLDRHRQPDRRAAAGIPILGWLTYVDGPVWGLAALAAGVSILRWPVIYLWRWVRRGARPLE